MSKAEETCQNCARKIDSAQCYPMVWCLACKGYKYRDQHCQQWAPIPQQQPAA